jgi:hypothetical protein
MEVRSRLERQGSIFQTNSDTEVIVHLIALSREQTLPEAIADALQQVEGAFSLVLMSSGPDHCGARSARLSAAGYGTHSGAGRAKHATPSSSPRRLAPSI